MGFIQSRQNLNSITDITLRPVAREHCQLSCDIKSKINRTFQIRTVGLNILWSRALAKMQRWHPWAGCISRRSRRNRHIYQFNLAFHSCIIQRHSVPDSKPTNQTSRVYCTSSNQAPWQAFLSALRELWDRWPRGSWTAFIQVPFTFIRARLLFDPLQASICFSCELRCTSLARLDARETGNEWQMVACMCHKRCTHDAINHCKINMHLHLFFLFSLLI